MIALLLAAGRGERMRPLTDTTPKPLLTAGGRPLIEWQILRLAQGGFRDLVVNHAHLGAQIEDALGDGARLGVRIRYSPEPEPLETAGGIVHALPLLESESIPAVVLVASADVFCDYDYSQLHAQVPALVSGDARLHLVMVPNPPYHAEGDFGLDGGRLSLLHGERLTFGNIGLYRTDLFHGFARGKVEKLTPHYRRWVAAGLATGEKFTGRWFNVGTPGDLRALDRLLGGG